MDLEYMFNLAEEVARNRKELRDWAYALINEINKRNVGIIEAAFKCAINGEVELSDLKHNLPKNWMRKWVNNGVIKGVEPTVSQGEYREFITSLPSGWLTKTGERMSRLLLKGYCERVCMSLQYRNFFITLGNVMYAPVRYGHVPTYALAYNIIRSVPDELMYGVRSVRDAIEIAKEHGLAITRKDFEVVGIKPFHSSLDKMKHVISRVKVIFPSDECKLAGWFTYDFMKDVVRRVKLHCL